MVQNPFCKCLHPKRIVNPYTNESMVVPCGHCQACTLAKNSRYAFQCDLESYSSKHTLFITLTYANRFIPRAMFVDSIERPYGCDLIDKEKGNRRTKEGNFIDEVIRELCRWDESDGITQDYWGLLRLHKEEQITVVEYEEGFYMFKGRVDLCIGGSPCQGFSFAGKQLAFDDPRSKLFFEFVRIWREIKEINPNAKFLLENVRMKKEHEKVISDYLGLEPMFICSSLFSAQQRKRLYWSNINTIETMFGIKTHFDLPDDKGLKLIDILENKQDGQIAVEISKQKRHGKHILESSFNNKSNSLTTFEHNSMVGIFPVSEDFYLDDDNIKKAKNYKGARTFKTGNSRGAMPFPNKLNWKSLCLTTTNGSSRTVNFVDDGFGVRRLTPLEWERLQTVPENYTDCVAKSHRYKMLGNGWTVSVISHIFSFLKEGKIFSNFSNENV